MYTSRYINKHYQFGETNYTLILEDLEGGKPTYRIEKTFKLSPDEIDQEFLYQEAKKEISRILIELEQEPAIEDQQEEQGEE